ncbi:MAG: hypothetical protein M1831_007402 [Alyxoria varia]|nr:MAG: hypothetical protein M1831_007402 [Alyxoria varia]
MFDIIPNVLTSLLAHLLPIYFTYKSLTTATTTPNPLSPHTTTTQTSATPSTALRPWTIYLLTVTLLHTTESLALTLCPLLSYLPLYAWARLFLHLYLLLPGDSQGATFIYTTYISPFLSRHESAIERSIANLTTRARQYGQLGAWAEAAIEWTRINVLGWGPSQKAREKEESERRAREWGAAPSEYLAQILGRFATPAAGNNANEQIARAGVPSASSKMPVNLPAAAGGLLNALGAAANQLAASKPAATDTGAPPPPYSTATASTQTPDAPPSSTSTGRESRPHEKRQAREQQPFPRSRSEAEFVNVDRDDAVPRNERDHLKSGSGSTGWGAWIWGGGSGKGSNGSGKSKSE